jgi:hypothetical protein
MVEELRELAKRSFVSSFSFALVHAGLEDRDQAFMWLEKAGEEASVPETPNGEARGCVGQRRTRLVDAQW